MTDFSLPGRFVGTGTHTAYLEESGEGSPTVLLISGLGDNGLVWRLVQPEVAAFAHVVSYDRAGLGSSTPTGTPRTSANIAAELHALLVAAQIAPPYILVGHSMGGVYARAFIRAYPGEVVGLVLVDSSHEQQFDQLPSTLFEERQRAWEIELAKLRASTQAELQDYYRQQLQTALPSEVHDINLARIQPGIYETIDGELKGYRQSSGALPPDLLGDLPLIVLTNVTTSPGESEEQSAAWSSAWPRMQLELTGLSSRGEQRKLEGGHYLQIDNPTAVVDAIRDVVERVQAH